MVLANYNEFISEVNSKTNIIPIIVSTDQHGTIGKDSEVYKYINEIVDFSKISKIINLGDTVYSEYNKEQLDDYKEATKMLPKEKRLEIIGNHERSGNPDINDLKERYSSFGRDDSGFNFTYTVNDPIFKVRYLSIDTKEKSPTYDGGYLESNKAEYIVNELQKESENDIVILSHPYLFRDAMITRDNVVFTGSDYFIGGASSQTDVKASFVEMLKNRKIKGSGVLLDSEGNSHPYDFSKCNSDILMSLHGHHHTEGYGMKEGFTEFLFQSMREDEVFNLKEPNCFYFAYIDKTNQEFKCWKNVKGYSSWKITIWSENWTNRKNFSNILRFLYNIRNRRTIWKK